MRKSQISSTQKPKSEKPFWVSCKAVSIYVRGTFTQKPKNISTTFIQLYFSNITGVKSKPVTSPLHIGQHINNLKITSKNERKPHQQDISANKGGESTKKTHSNIKITYIVVFLSYIAIELRSNFLKLINCVGEWLRSLFFIMSLPPTLTKKQLAAALGITIGQYYYHVTILKKQIFTPEVCKDLGMTPAIWKQRVWDFQMTKKIIKYFSLTEKNFQ